MGTKRKWGRARQKLFEALYVLVGPERLRLRLTYAATPLVALRSTDFPLDCQQRFQNLQALLTQTPISSKFRSEAGQIAPAQAKWAAAEILSLYIKVSGGL